MTEVVKEKEEVKEQVPQYTPAEETAMENGWQPKEAWVAAGKDAEEWIPARQFIKQGELFGRINSYKHKIQGLEKTVTTLVKHNEQVYQAGYKEALDSLRQERRAALQEGDVEKVEKVEDKIEELRETHQKETQERQAERQQATGPQMRPEFEDWMGRNTWYGQNQELSGYADGVAKALIKDAQENSVELNYPKMLQEVSRKVRAKFPENFTKGTQRQMTDDTKEGARIVRNRDDVESQMTADEIQIMNTLVRSGISKEKYLKDYKAVNHKKGR